MVNEGSTRAAAAGAFLLVRPGGELPGPAGLAGLVLDLAGASGHVPDGTGGSGSGRARLLGRVGPPSSPGYPGELARAAALGARSVVLTGSVGRAAVEETGARLAVLEAELGLADGGIGIVPSIDDAAGLLRLPELAAARLPRLRAVLVDPAAFAAGLGIDALDAVASRHLLAVAVTVAAAAGVPALAAVGTGMDLPARCAALRREGFAGVLLDRPEDVAAAAAIFA